MKKLLFGAVLLTALVFAMPLVLSDFAVNLATEIYIMAIFAMSLGLIMGYAGMVSLGHAGFFGIGAYTVAVIGQHVANTYLLLLLAVVMSGLIALVTGAVFIRTSKFYFLMITLAFGQLLYVLFWQLKTWTGGADGMSVSAVMNFGFGEIVSPNGLYYVMGLAFVISYFFLHLLVESPAGKITKGVMENEARMSALGHNVRVYKLLVYTLSGSLAGLAGALYAYFNVFVSPDLSSWMFSGQVMVMVIIGGVGTLLGPALGASVFIYLQNFMSTYTERWPMIMGVLLVALVLAGKGGLIHWLQHGKRLLVSRKRTGEAVSQQTVKKGEAVH
ncbi:branched-chain amino acid ABC transporter permease [Geobacillus sp. 46C-IIa]|uniref:branched-chain amino acid ABC transporter permease n=1 Tax=Geobacillus sp. 46C-IIa TaxID=1963025 RepID=UPI0009BE42B5|nr:branched-chain amino acid ABC transporter permease [Geobacillus sp. 46C-IIa]OQP05268.1 branched-chain amino acid ABC transporter permease [Geobacillus sp. 46C-IIa]QNU26589.1 branched-chain amino acid ABC transporter permease [Geobacillus sp. 46C-IIa]